MSQILLEIEEIFKEDTITNTINVCNSNYYNIYLGLSSAQQYYTDIFIPIIEFYNEYSNQLKEAYTIYEQASGSWDDFLTKVQSNSAKWLQPFTLFYPDILQEPFTDNSVETINNWVKKYYPITNEDGTINYVENQKLIVNCYTYVQGTEVDIIDSPYSYCKCKTQSGNISLHCQTIITGGWIHCNQGSYNCQQTLDCYPQSTIDCWYETPFLHTDFSPIGVDEAISSKQDVVSKIKANITMKFNERYEYDIKTLFFEIQDCDWVYMGANITL
jgi:hypothetical protein